MVRFNQAMVENVHLPDGPAEIVRLAGVGGYNDGHKALFSALGQMPSGRVLVTGPGATPTALWASRAGASLHYLNGSIAETQSLNETLRRYGLPHAVSLDHESTCPTACDLALVHLPRGRARQQELLQFSAYHLRTGGKLIFVGAKNEGIRTAVDDAAELLGQAGVVARKGGYHAAMAYRTANTLSSPRLTFQETTLILDGFPTHLVSCVGAFAHDRLDGGAAALIQGMRITPGASTLDMGCGTGLVALAAARREAQVIATDVSYRAVASARRTLDANHFATVPVHHAHGATGIEDGTLDTVVTNPPFHQGHDVDFEVAQFFVSEAARVLKSHGQLFLVANAFLDYGAWLTRSFATTGVVWEDRQYRVWRATKEP